MSDLADLRWVRIFTPIHIPKYLIEQIKDREWSTEDYLKYHESNCLQPSENGPVLNPFSHLYVIVNKDNVTKGFLWFTVEPLTKNIQIQNYSVDKEYWGKGKAVEKLAEHLKYILKKANLNKIYWVTNYPKHSSKHGFKQSKGVLMEYSEEEDGKDIHRGIDPRGQRKHADAGADSISVEHSDGDRGECFAGIPAVLAAV